MKSHIVFLMLFIIIGLGGALTLVHSYLALPVGNVPAALLNGTRDIGPQPGDARIKLVIYKGNPKAQCGPVGGQHPCVGRSDPSGQFCNIVHGQEVCSNKPPLKYPPIPGDCVGPQC
jgi:hypothetical protein